MRVLAFARIREIIGTASSERDVAGGATVEDLWNELGREFPALVALGSSTRFARNGTLVAAAQALADGDELSLLPPFGGG